MPDSASPSLKLGPDGWPTDAKFSRGEVIGMLRNLIDRFVDGDPAGEGDPNKRPAKMVNRIMWNRAHAHQLAAADTTLSEPYDKAYRYQTHIPLNVHRELKARMLENPVRVKATPPKPTANAEKVADDLATVLEAGLEEMAKREGVDVVGAIADGQILEAYGVLHWGRAKLPELPSYGVDDMDMYGVADEVMARYREMVAAAGFPYWLECPHPSTFLWDRDRRSGGPPNGLGVGVLLRTVTLFDAQAALREQRGGLSLSWNDLDNKIQIYRPTEKTLDSSQDQDGGKRITLASFWTRDECYELACPAEGGFSTMEAMAWQLIDFYPHEWGMPPFIIVPAVENNDPDPVIRYQPLLEGVYRHKPFADRMVTLMLILAEQIALPIYYLEETSTGQMLMQDDGTPLTLTRDAAAAYNIPSGYTLKTVPFELNPAFVEAVKYMIEAMDDARPQTGSAEIGTGTQPWTARLQQQQASVTPKLLLRNAAQGIQQMMHAIARDISQNRVPVSGYAMGKSGKADRAKTITLDPDKIKNLDIDVNIDAVSGAERITLTEHLRGLLNDPNVMYSLREFVEEAEGKSDVDEVIAARMAEKLWKEQILPMRQKQMLTEKYGKEVVVGPNGDFFGMGGQPLAPEEVLQRNGVNPPPMPQPNPGAPGAPGGGPNLRNQVQMPALPALQAPGTVALPGRR